MQSEFSPLEQTELKAIQKKLGARIQEIRISKGHKNYEKFAFAHDLGRSQFGRYENGSDMKFSTLVRIAHALDVSLEELFKGF
jgi:transcriptional regulator with XRE-family HTH domain